MRVLVYLAAVATIFDGIMHLLFPDHWDALWHAETRKMLPGLGQRLDRLSEQYPTKRHMQRPGWIALGPPALVGRARRSRGGALRR